LVTEAVTKGLDPSVPIRDTDDAFIPKIPTHWRLIQLRYVLSTPLAYGANEAGDQDYEGDPRYVRITDIRDDGTLRVETRRSLPADIAFLYLLQDGDVLLARSGATVGKSFIYRPSWGTCCFAGYLIRARCHPERLNGDFLHRFLSSNSYWGWVGAIQTQATIQNIGADRYATIPVPLAPLAEQVAIVRYLNERLAGLDKVGVRSADMIEQLRERRSALITAAVTGQIDVTQSTPALVAA
jgi:type I restriction enzyme S subunit